MYGTYIALLQIVSLNGNGGGKAKVISITDFNLHNGAIAGLKIDWLEGDSQHAEHLNAGGLYYVSKEQAEKFKNRLTSEAYDMGKIFFATYGDNMLGLFEHTQRDNDGRTRAVLITAVDLSELDMFSKIEELEKKVEALEAKSAQAST